VRGENDAATVADLAALGISEQLRPAFNVFVSCHEVGWVRFAHLTTGSAQQAEAVVDETVLQLAESWEHALSGANVECYAMNLLKTVIVRRIGRERDESRFVDTAAFLRAVEHGSRRRFAVLSESLGLYSAIAQLPERQYMVIVLRYVLGYDDQRVAVLLGVTPSTVRSTAHMAKRRLAHTLNLRLAAAGQD
jgi:RNA polymerase sigma-70 factor (ECF subfamily)